MKRISFNEQDAAHLYELALQNFQDECQVCVYLKARLEKFIGPEETRHAKKMVEKYPYNDTTWTITSKR